MNQYNQVLHLTQDTKWESDKITIILFVCFVALRPKSTAMVIAGRSVHLTTLFLGRLDKWLTSNSCTYFRL